MNRHNKIRVFVVDDHVLVREGIRKVFALTEEIEVIGEAARPEELWSLLDKGVADLVLLDLSLPGLEGVAAVEQVVSRAPQTPVLVLTMHADPVVATRAVRAGAKGYLTKDGPSHRLVEAVRQVAGGARFVDPVLASQLIDAERTREAAPHEDLSWRERQVLMALVNGRSLVDIAHELSLAANTVSTYKYRLMEKLGQQSLSELIRYAVRHGLVK